MAVLGPWVVKAEILVELGVSDITSPRIDMGEVFQTLVRLYEATQNENLVLRIVVAGVYLWR